MSLIFRKRSNEEKEFDKLVRKNDKLNCELVEYILRINDKNKQPEGECLKKNDEDKNNSKLIFQVDEKFKKSHNLSDKEFNKIKETFEIVNNIAISDEDTLYNDRKINKILKGLCNYSYYYMLYNGCYNGSIDKLCESLNNFIKQELRIVLSQGKLEKAKIFNKEKFDKLIEENEKVISKLEKYSDKEKTSLEIRKIIFEEIKQCISKTYTNKGDLQDAQKVDQIQNGTAGVTFTDTKRIVAKKTSFETSEERKDDICKRDQGFLNSEKKISQTREEVNEVEGIMRNNVEKALYRDGKLEELKEKAENIEKGGQEFKEITKKVERKYKITDKQKLCLVVAAATIVIVIALAYCIYAAFSSPSQNLDNVVLKQNIGELIHFVV